jgi:hypothetical protein
MAQEQTRVGGPVPDLEAGSGEKGEDKALSEGKSFDPVPPPSGGGVVDGVRVNNSPTRCPFCHEQVGVEDPARVCRDCLSRHHTGCWADHGSCSSCSCTQSLETAQAERAGPGSCRACGLQRASARYTCPCCATDVCDGCYTPRFRRCVTCSVTLLQEEKRLEQLRGKLHNAQGLMVVGALIALGTMIGMAVCIAEGAVAAAPFLGLISLAAAILAVRGRSRSNELDREVAEMELKLAPFEQSLGDWVRTGTRRLMRKVGL